MSLHDVWPLNFDFLPQKPVFVEPVQELLSTDAGLLVFRQWDEEHRFTAGFAEQLEDCRRSPQHSVLEMVRSRVFGILAGYEDQNDHDALRSDAVFKLLANRLPEDEDLAEILSNVVSL
jgi:Transposase DDE domain group 1